MSKYQLYLYISLFTPLFTFAQQSNVQRLTTKVKSADTVLLISHGLVAGSTDVYLDENGKEISLPKLLINGKFNRAVVKEEQVIRGSDIDKLLEILERPFSDSVIMQGGCFLPKQSILLIKDRKTSYIDICFHCGSYITSKDLENIPAFDQRRWDELEAYFRKHGLTYGLDQPVD